MRFGKKGNKSYTPKNVVGAKYDCGYIFFLWLWVWLIFVSHKSTHELERSHIYVHEKCCIHSYCVSNISSRSKKWQSYSKTVTRVFITIIREGRLQENTSKGQTFGGQGNFGSIFIPNFKKIVERFTNIIINNFELLFNWVFEKVSSPNYKLGVTLR